jgi:hypothetical protein
MMNVSLDYRGVDAQLGAILQAKRDRGLNHQVVDRCERLRRQPIETAVERVVFGHRIPVEIGKLTQRHTVGDPFTQLAIIPILDAHQNQRAQHLRRRQSAATRARLLQTTHQIASHPLGHLMPAIQER